jgi:hypothetical protein
MGGTPVTLDFTKAQSLDATQPAQSSGPVTLDFSKSQQLPQPSFWRQVYNRSGLGALQIEAQELSDWAKDKRDKSEVANDAYVAKTGKPLNLASSIPDAYDVLHRTAGLVSSFMDPKNLAITGGVIAANTNPFTGIPVDAALVAHGGYGVYKDAPAAVHGDPEAAQRALMSASEMTGGAAGVGGNVVALPAALRGVRSLFGPASAPTTSEVAESAASVKTQDSPVQGGVGAPAGDVAPGAPVGRIARTLGISDPPPNQLLTKAIKPLSSNSGWDNAIAKAAPEMKAAEADLGHPITGVDDALNAASIAKKSLWQQYSAKLGQAGDATIDGNAVADAMMKSIDARTRLQNPDLVERIQKVADTYRRTMSVAEAEDFLQSANNDLHSYYAKNKVGRQVAAKDPTIGNVVAEADQLRDSLYSKLDELTGTGAADLKQRYGALSNVEAELLRRKNVSARQAPESLAEQLSMARAYGKIAVGTLRASPSSMMEGVQSLAAAKWLKARGTSDAMITRAFQALGKPQQTAPAPAPVTPPWTTTGAAIGAASQPPVSND